MRDKVEWKDIVSHRQGVTYFALFEDGRPASGAADTNMTQQVRGKLFKADGIWTVATDPAARRKDYYRGVMAELLSDQRKEDQAFTCLYPFRESFYERMGYVTFPIPYKANFIPAGLLPLLEKDPGGEIERVVIGEGYDVYRDYLHRMQTHTHGMGVFVHGDMFAAQKNRFWLALAKVDGELAGLMLYQLKGDEETQFLLRAIRFYYETSQGKYLLLQWIARHVDQASDAEIWLAPFEQPETWLADIKIKTESMVRAPMGRILDVAKIGGMSTGHGRFSTHISNPLCPWNEGIWMFESVDGLIEVSRGDRPDCSLSIQALTALIYGTHNLGDFNVRAWGNVSKKSQVTMREMFPPVQTYLHEIF